MLTKLALLLLSVTSLFAQVRYANPNFDTNSRVLYPTNLVFHLHTTGASNSVSLNSMLADFKDIRSFMQGTNYANTTNDIGPIINLAANSAATGMGINNVNASVPHIYIPPGLYTVNTPIALQNGAVLESISSRATILSNASISADMITIAPTNGANYHHKLTVRNISLRGSPSATNGSLIHMNGQGLQNTPWLLLDDVTFGNGWNHITVSNGVEVLIYNSEMIAANNYSFYQEGALNLFSMQNSRIYGAQNAGIYFRPGTGTILNSTFEYSTNGIVGFNSGASSVPHSLAILGCFFEHNVNNNIYLDGVDNAIINFYGSQGGTNGITILGARNTFVHGRIDSIGTTNGYTLWSGNASNGQAPDKNMAIFTYNAWTMNNLKGWAFPAGGPSAYTAQWGNSLVKFGLNDASTYIWTQGSNIVSQYGNTDWTEALVMRHDGTSGILESIGGHLIFNAHSSSNIYMTNNTLWSRSIGPIATATYDLGADGNRFRYLWGRQQPLITYSNAVTVVTATELQAYAGITRLHGSGGAVVLTNLPTITTNLNRGQVLRLTGGTNTVELLDNAFLSGTRLNLPGTLTNLVLTNGIFVDFIYDDTRNMWDASAYSEGSSGSTFPVSFVSTYATNSGANTAAYFNSSGQLTSLAGVSDTELGYISELTSDAQTQLNSKASAFATGVGVTNEASILSGNYYPSNNITFTTNEYGRVLISSTGGGSGETNTASTLGTGYGVWYDKSGVDLRFNSISNGIGVSVSSNANLITVQHNIEAGANVTLSTNGSAIVITAATTGGSGDDVYVNGANVTHPDFDDSSTAIWSVNNTNVTVYPTNLANAQIASGAAIDATKIADGSVTSTEFQYIGGLTSDAQTQIDGKQAAFTTGVGVTNQSNVLKHNVEAGSNITLSTNATTGALIVTSSGGGGETNTASNLGTGYGLWYDKNSVDLRFNSISNGIGVTVSSNANLISVSHNIEAGANITLSTNGSALVITGAAAGGSGDDVYVNGANVTHPDFDDSSTLIWAVNNTNVTAYPTNIANAQIAAAAAIATSKLALSSAISETGTNLSLLGSLTAHNGTFTNSLTVGSTNITGAIAGKQTAFTTGVGVTNVANVLSANITNGSNITLATNANGLLEIASSATVGGDTYGFVRFQPQSAKLPASNPATIDASGNGFILIFDDATEQTASFEFMLPEDYASNPTIHILWYSPATSGDVVWGLAVSAYTTTLNEDPTLDSYDTENTGEGIAGGSLNFANELSWSSYTLTNNDSMVDADLIRLKIARKVADVADTASENANIRAIVFSYTPE